MYFTLYDLLREYIYGLDAVLTGDMQMILTVLSTIGVLFVVALPFLVVWRFVKLFL